MKRINRLVFLIICFGITFVNAQFRSIKIGDDTRRFILYVPSSYNSTSSNQVPLVFNFHGGGMTASEQMMYSGMNKTAEKYGFIIVYPVGKNQDWNVGFDMSYKYGSDDISYVKGILNYVQGNYNIDKDAIFACGLSRGGFFSHRLAAEMPDVFSAIASVSGLLPDSVKYYHKSTKNVSVLQVHGTSDRVVNYNGKDGGYSSAQQTFDYWTRHNQLDISSLSISKIDSSRNDNTSIEFKMIKYKSIAVQLITINGGGHTWPGSDSFNIGFPLGPTTKHIDINEVIWDFFKSHKRKQ